MKKTVFALIAALIIALAASGCARNDVAKDDNLMSDVPVMAGDIVL